MLRITRGGRPLAQLAAFALALGIAGGLAPDATAQPAARPADGGSETAISPREIEQRRAELARELEAVRAAGAAGNGHAEADLERLDRLYLQIVTALKREAELRELRTAAEAAATAPGDAFRSPPPHPLSLFDAIADALEAQREQTRRLETVAEDAQASLKAMRDLHEQNERARRLAKDAFDDAKDGAERAALEQAWRAREIESRLSGERVTLRRVELENARLALELQRTSERRVADTLAWLQDNLGPRPEDLEATLAGLSARRADLESSLDTARQEGEIADQRLAAAQSAYAALADPDAAARARLEARRLESAAARRRVELVAARIERTRAIEEAWRRRYRLLEESVPRAATRDWRAEAQRLLDEAARHERGQRARLSDLYADRDARRARLEDADVSPTEARWIGAQIDALDALVASTTADLASLAENARLERRLLAAIDARSQEIDLADRARDAVGRLRELWRYELMASGDEPITVGKVTTALLVFVLGFSLARRFAHLLGRRLFPRFGLDEGAAAAYESLLFYGFLVAIFLFALRSVDIPLTAFAVLGGALAIGVGFGSQNVVGNFISGLILLAERPIKRGDSIEVGGIYGFVERIGLRSTRVRTPDNIHVIVPNSSFLETNVVNWTLVDPVVRVKLALGVAYGSPTREVVRLVHQAIGEQADILRDPEPMVLFMDFGSDALQFEARFWIRMRETVDRLRIQSDVRFRIDELFREAGIVIAFPQRDVHLDASAPLEVRVVEGEAGGPTRG